MLMGQRSSTGLRSRTLCYVCLSRSVGGFHADQFCGTVQSPAAGTGGGGGRSLFLSQPFITSWMSEIRVECLNHNEKSWNRDGSKDLLMKRSSSGLRWTPQPTVALHYWTSTPELRLCLFLKFFGSFFCSILIMKFRFWLNSVITIL